MVETAAKPQKFLKMVRLFHFNKHVSSVLPSSSVWRLWKFTAAKTWLLQCTVYVTFHWKTIRYINLKLSNGNRTEWSSIRSVIIRVINKIGRPRSGSPICLITSMITDRIGRHEVLLPINHNFNKICDIIGYFLNQNTRNSKFCFASSEKKPFKRARDGAYCPIT